MHTLNERLNRNKKGFTLIEVIISIAIMAVVISIAYSLLFYGNNVFAIGTRQYNVQSSIRLASDFITNAVRYATEIEIVDPSTTPITVTDDNQYILLNGYNAVEHRSMVGSNYVSFGLTGSLEFEKSGPSGDEKSLSFNIGATDNTESYSLESEVLILNLHLHPSINSITGDSFGTAIRFKSPDINVLMPFNAAPYATLLYIDGEIKRNKTVRGMFTYNDAEGDLEGDTTFKWYVSDTETGTKTQIPGENERNFRITNEYVDKFIYFEVTPVASDGAKTGTAVSTIPYGPVRR